MPRPPIHEAELGTRTTPGRSSRTHTNPFNSPDYMFIPEGDTPTFLYLIQNGLGYSEHPEYGSWGGRYALNDISGDGLCSRHYHDTIDNVVGADGRKYSSNQVNPLHYTTCNA